MRAKIHIAHVLAIFCVASVAYAAKMNRTPHGHGFYSRSGRQRGLTADQVVNMAAYESYQSGFQRRKEGYGPNESLLSGEYRSLTDNEELEADHANLITPLAGSSRYNSVRGQSSNRHYDGAGPEGGELNLTAMLQEQQHILYQVLDTQKKIQKKQEEFEIRLSELAQRSERSSSSSSPDHSGRKKCRITRELTVSTPYNANAGIWQIRYRLPYQNFAN